MLGARNVQVSGRKIGYARVSTEKQTLFQYIDALTEFGCSRIFIEEPMSATADHRPELKAAEAELRDGDAFVVLSIDRAFRSAIDALLFLERINTRGVSFISLYQMIDTNTPEGKQWFTYSAAAAEYERAVISRRTKEKMAAAKRRGQHLGRPHKLDATEVVEAYKLVREDGCSVADVAERYNVSALTMRRAFYRVGLTR